VRSRPPRDTALINLACAWPPCHRATFFLLLGRPGRNPALGRTHGICSRPASAWAPSSWRQARRPTPSPMTRRRDPARRVARASSYGGDACGGACSRRTSAVVAAGSTPAAVPARRSSRPCTRCSAPATWRRCCRGCPWRCAGTRPAPSATRRRRASPTPSTAASAPSLPSSTRLITYHTISFIQPHRRRVHSVSFSRSMYSCDNRLPSSKRSFPVCKLRF
jgi:hypothetical protein